MADAILRIKTVMDVGDAVSNVGVIQKSLSKLKLPDNLKNNLSKNIGAFYKEYEKYQKKMSDGIKTQGDFNQVERSLNHLKSLYSEIGKDAAKAIKIDPEALFNLDEGKFKNIVSKIEQTLKQLNDVKIDTKAFSGPIEEIEKLTKNQKIVGNNGILTRMMGNIDAGNISQAKKEYNSLIQEIQRAAPKLDEFGNRINKPGTFSIAKYEQLQQILSKLGTAFTKAGTDVKPLEDELNRLQTELAETVSAASKDLTGQISDYNKQAEGVEKVTDSLKRMHEEEYSFNRQAQDIDRQIQTYFGLSQMIRKVADIARDAFATVKDLDAAMVETAVVTNFDVGDMWNMLPTYTANANQLGSTIKDVYEAATLYYQQGLNQAQSMGLANETLKMARIGGLQAAEATNMMTAALRGFNMEINQVSAKRINDVYSELAAITAADTKEIGSAMERTASIANSANMEFETTSAFLAQMIETTREAPENLGTAMKTIIARFQEMKQDPTKLVDSEGVALDANKIDTALKTIGVDLKNQKGEFRDLDTVFLEISEKWDSLTQGQQRYIATIAAGSRQQSRFIAMMQNYERVKELVDAANNSAGASQKQFEKTLDSMSSKLNRLKNAWDQFTMGLMNNQILKGGVDALTGFFTVVNKIFDVLTKPFPDPFGGLIKSALTLTSTLALLNLGKKGARGAVMAGVGWWKGEGNIAQNFASGWGGANAAKAGTTDGKIYAENFNKAIKSGHFKEAFNLTKQQAQRTKPDNKQYQNTFKAAYGQFSAAEVTRDWTPEIQAELERIFDRATKGVDLSKYGIKDADKYKRGFISRLKGGITSPAEEALRLEKTTGGAVKLNEAGVNEVDQATNKFEKFGLSVQNAGSSLQAFGLALQGTPLAPFGTLLSTIGGLLQGFSGAIGAVSKAWTAGMASMTASTAAGAGIMTASFKAIGVGLKKLWLDMGPIGWIILGITAAVAAFKGLDKLITTPGEKLEQTSDAAAKASEAFDSAKQETSELNDAISRVRENENAFDNLVAGTADFNEQMATANEQITELLQKYPMLNDYVSTDKNGLMHISEEGLEAVKDYQKQIQARASATNIIQSADLAALENQQKAEKLRSKWFKVSDEERKKNKEDAQLLEDRAKAEVELARRNAARTILNGKEIKDVEAMSAIYANLYEEKRKVAETEVNGMSKKDIAQQYADYHGYTYTKSTNKMKDTEGNEVDFDDKVIKDEVIENTVLLDFEANAESLDNVLTNLNNKFSETLGEAYKDSDSFVSDLLSSNIETNTDLLKDVLSDSSTQLSDLVHSMSDEELAAILGVTQSEVSDNLSTYQNQAIDLLTERANSIVEAQSQSYAKLGEMMARASDVGLVAANTNTIQNSISKQIAELSTQQANTLSTIGQTLEQNVGPEAMETFIHEASGIYLQKNEQLSKEFDGILNNINWESPTSRLEGYHNAINSTNEDIQHWGQSMRASAGEANILGDAFTEFLSKDWEELSQNADNFKNSIGEIDNAGIMAAAKESKTLKSLLDSGEVSATGLAKALQAVEDGSLSEVNSTVLELLSSMNRLGDAALEAHEIISNFDPGIDFGEGEDFVKENAEKAKEYYNNNEWGNQQLQNYIKLAAGTDRWNEALRKNDGNLQKTTDDLMKYVTTFSDGFQPAWDQMISGKNINGTDLSKAIDNAVEHVDTTGVSKKLGDKFKEVSVSWDDEGFMQIDVGDLTTSELETYFQEIYGVSKEYAQLLMQDLANYDGEISAALAKNDLQATVGDKDFQNRHLDREGNLTFSNADLQAFEAAGGSLKELEQAAGGAINTFKVVDEEGNRLKANTKMLQEFDKVFGTGKGKIDSLITDSSLQGAGGKLDLSKLIDITKTKAGFDEQQSLDAAYKAYQRANKAGQSTLYDGVELEKGLDRKGWEEAIAKAQDTSQWIPIGEAIAQGFMNVINGNKPSEDSALNSSKYSGQNLTQKEYSGFKKEVDATADKMAKIDQTTEQGRQKVAQLRQDFVNANMDGLARLNTSQFNQVNSQLGFTKEQIDAINQASMELTQEKRIPITADGSQAKGEEEAVRSSWQQLIDDGTTNPLIIDADSSKAEGKVEEVRTSYGQLVNEGKTNPLIINAQTKNEPKTKQQQTQQTRQTQQTQQPQPQTTTAYKVKVEGQDQVEQLQTKIEKLNELVNKGGTYKLTTSGSIPKASKGNQSVKQTQQAPAKKTVSTQIIKVTANTAAAQSKINALINKFKKTYTLKYKASGPKSIKVPVSANFTGSWTKTVKINKSDAKGQNNYIPHRTMPTFGSLARGIRYGRLGPKDRGGLTLTGEKGYEVAWLPSENRSMILGTQGPQMVNLPKDAVVYTHEQSEDILKKKQTIDAGSEARGGRTNKSGSGGGSSKGKKKKKKSKKKGKKNKNTNKGTINNFSMEEVVRFNIDPALARLTSEIEKRSKEIEKSLTKIGNTYGDIVDSTNKQIAALQGVKDKNQALYNSYKRQLAELRGQKGSVSWTDDKGKSHDKTINFSSYLNADGSVNQAAIQKLSSRAEREAVFNLVSGAAKPLVDGMQSAQKAMEDAVQQMEDLGQKISEAFYQWKSELTEVYDLTQRINDEVSFTDRFTSQIELELAKLGSGFGDTAESIKNIRKVLIRSNDIIKKQIANQQQMIAARQRELDAALSYEDEIAQRQAFEASDFGGNTYTKKATVEWAKGLEAAAIAGRKYVQDVYKDIDGSIQYRIDWAQFNADRDKDPLNKSTYEAIKSYLDDLNNAATEFNNAIKDQTDFIKQTYESLKEYQDKIVDFEDTLIKGVEEEIKNETENAKKISSSIANALKDLLDEVKRKLDERRKQEDNAKTERDIAQKQQRLAALRADTAGGHQVEIAQLEKEIADAQQDYGRTLEDQLLDRLQQQADKASEQRERQIELAETSNEISAANNKELVDMWLREPEKYKEEIKAAWLEANGYDEKGEAGQYVLRNQFESDFAELVTAVEQTDFKNHFNQLEADTNSLVALLQELTNGSLGRYDELALDENALLDATKRNTDSIVTLVEEQGKMALAQLKAQGVDVDTLKLAGYGANELAGAGYTAKELREGGFSLPEIVEAGYNTIEPLKEAGYTAGEIKGAGVGETAKDFKDANFEAKDLIDLFGLKELVDADYGIKDLKDAGVSAKTLREEMGYGIDQLKGIYSLQELKPAYTASEFGAANISYADAKAAGYTRTELQYVPQYATLVKNEIAAEAARAAAAAREAEYKRKIAAAAANGKTSAKELKEVEKVANAAGHGARTWMPALAATAGLTWKEILKAAKGTWNKDRLASSFGGDTFIKAYNSVYGSGQYKKHAGKGTPYSYKTGGLADYTGPAWLDGTPSKPELVLNAADTKNFLALKDVLSRAVHSSNSVSNSYGDATYEININVDHLNNDYDVDKVVERVKKIIVKDAGYRNVTQVRNFR